MFQTIDHKMDRTYELPLINQSCQLERDLHEYRYFESTFSPRNGQVFHRLKQPSLEHVHRLDAFVSRVSTRIFRAYAQLGVEIWPSGKTTSVSFRYFVIRTITPRSLLISTLSIND